MWKPASTVTGQVTGAVRLNNSVNGNPRYRVIFKGSDGVMAIYITSTDSACSYEVGNVMSRWNREAPIVTLGLTRAGRVATIDKV